jgi:hypothetical protein
MSKRSRETIEIRGAPEAIFDLVHDYGRRLDWDPFLREATILGGADEAGGGVLTRCVAHNGLAMETVYVSFIRPRSAAVKMTRGPAIFAAFAASWNQEEVEPGLTRVVYQFHLAARPNWLRWLFDPILNWVLARETRKRLAALKKTIERPVEEPRFENS